MIEDNKFWSPRFGTRQVYPRMCARACAHTHRAAIFKCIDTDSIKINLEE